MSAIRYRHVGRDADIRLDDETPQSDEPISLRIGSEILRMPIEEARSFRRGLDWAIADAQHWLDRERGGATLAETEAQRATSAAAVAEHERRERRDALKALDTAYEINRGAVIDFEARRRAAAMAGIERSNAERIARRINMTMSQDLRAAHAGEMRDVYGLDVAPGEPSPAAGACCPSNAAGRACGCLAAYRSAAVVLARRLNDHISPAAETEPMPRSYHNYIPPAGGSSPPPMHTGRMRLHFNRHGAAPLVWTIAALGTPAAIVPLWELAVADIACAAPITAHYAPKPTPDDEDGKASAWFETAGILTVSEDGHARIQAFGASP